MIVIASPCAADFDETVDVFKFSSLAQQVVSCSMRLGIMYDYIKC